MLYKLDSPELQQLITSGGVGVMPTDTVYGLVVSAKLPEAVSRLYELKDRRGKPGTILAASTDQLVELGMKRRYLVAVEQFWPGAVSVVVPCPELQYLHLGRNSLAVRIPDDPMLTELLAKTGPLQTSSANLTGQPTVDSIEEAKMVFGGKVDFYVNGGNLSNRLPSTIIRIDDDAVTVIRQGIVKIDL